MHVEQVQRVADSSVMDSALMGGYAPLAMMVVDPFKDQLVAANQAACQWLCINDPLPLVTPFSHRLSASLPLWVSFTDEVLVQKRPGRMIWYSSICCASLIG